MTDPTPYECPSPGSDAAAIMARRAGELADDGMPTGPPLCGLRVTGHLLEGGRLVRCIAPLGHTGPHVPME